MIQKTNWGERPSREIPTHELTDTHQEGYIYLYIAAWM
jgi:hypothetical protein